MSPKTCHNDDERAVQTHFDIGFIKTLLYAFCRSVKDVLWPGSRLVPYSKDYFRFSEQSSCVIYYFTIILRYMARYRIRKRIWYFAIAMRSTNMARRWQTMKCVSGLATVISIKLIGHSHTNSLTGNREKSVSDYQFLSKEYLLIITTTQRRMYIMSSL